jgi:hypothetical protein
MRVPQLFLNGCLLPLMFVACSSEGPAVAAKRFYRHHADFYSRDPVKIRAMVTPRFYAALEKEYACLGEGYICAVEAAPWVSAQDGDIREPITFETADKGGGEAEVRMSYTYYLSETRNWPQTVTLKLERRPGDTTWRIGDLIPPGGGSLLRQIEDWHAERRTGD